MQLPLQIAFHGVDKDPRIEDLVRERAAKLDRVCDHISRCSVVIEQPHRSRDSKAVYQVRIDLTVPPHHEIVVRQESEPTVATDELVGVVQGAFEAARRRLDKLTAVQNGRIKAHPQNEPTAIVASLGEEYGFLRTVDDREVYFHRNSVLGDRYEELEVGRAVAFSEEMGEKGPQATTVRPVGGGPTRVT